jgi:hypothetical protein
MTTLTRILRAELELIDAAFRMATTAGDRLGVAHDVQPLPSDWSAEIMAEQDRNAGSRLGVLRVLTAVALYGLTAAIAAVLSLVLGVIVRDPGRRAAVETFHSHADPRALGLLILIVVTVLMVAAN